MKAINYLLDIGVDEKSNIIDSIVNNYFNVDQRREFNEHIYKLYVESCIIDSDDEGDWPSKTEFESATFKEDYLDGFISDNNILVELEQYLSSDALADLEEWLIKEYDIEYFDELDE